MAAELTLVEVNSQTVLKTWPLLLAAIETADFIAVDLELSGLGRGITAVTRGSTIDEQYKTLCEVAKSYAILAMGVACFQWQPEDTKQIACKVKVFNISLLSHKSFIIDPSSAKFLINHGFDFNQLFEFGISYNPIGFDATVTKSSSEQFSIQALFVRLLLHGCPLVVHNGLLDLMFLYHSCYSTLPLSLDVFAADLSEMFEKGGVYDTKAITQCHLNERISYLEYIFRKSQYRNSLAEGHGEHYLDLSFSQYPSDVPVEGMCVAPPPLPSLDMLLEIKLCDTYVNHGFCRRDNCEKSHNVLVAIVQEEHRIELLKVKRKRKREQRREAHCKKLKGDVDEHDSHEQGKSEECADESNDTASADHLVEIFQQELSAARARLSGSQQTPSELHLLDEKTTKSASFGHRAGFDAFMTGYSFASYLISSSKKEVITAASSFSDTLEESGVKEMKNCVANKKNNNMPVKLVKSHFVKPSHDHRHLQERLRELYTQSAIHT